MRAGSAVTLCYASNEQPMTSRRLGTRTLVGVSFVFALSATNARSQAPAAPENPCAGMKLPAGTLEEALTGLGSKRGFEVSFANPLIRATAVAETPLLGANCVASITRALEDLNLSFAISEGPRKTVRKVVVVDFKSAVSSGPALPPNSNAIPEVVEEPPIVEAEAAAAAEPRKDKEPPSDDELIDMGDGMKLFKVPPVYVPMAPGLVPPNAVVAGPEVLAESHHGAETAQTNAVVTPTTAPAPAPTTPGKTPFPGSPVPPNAPKPKPSPQS